MPKSRIRKRFDIVMRSEEIRDSTLCLIAVEGEKTEVNYFMKFGNNRIKVITIPPPLNRSGEPKGLLKHLLEQRGKKGYTYDDSCWLVFDVDHRDNETIASVCKMAREKQVKVAISNPCFEYWLFLHYEEADQIPTNICSTPQNDRPDVMKGACNYDYSKLRLKEFQADVQAAIHRAKVVDQAGEKEMLPCPGTRVYLLVESLPFKTIETV